MAREREERTVRGQLSRRRRSPDVLSQAELRRMAAGDHSLPMGTVAHVELVCREAPLAGVTSFPVLSEAWEVLHPIRVAFEGLGERTGWPDMKLGRRGSVSIIRFSPSSPELEAVMDASLGENVVSREEEDAASAYVAARRATLSRQLVAEHPDLAEAAKAQAVKPMTIRTLHFTTMIRGTFESIEKLLDRIHF